MKLWHSFVKEMLLASRSFYFFIEIVVAVIFVAVVLILVPEQSEFRQDEYIYLDMPGAQRILWRGLFLVDDDDNTAETVEYEIEGETISTTLFQSEGTNVYVTESEAEAIALADAERDFAGIIRVDDSGETTYTYYMQGYETERVRNIYKVAHLTDVDTMQATFDAQDVRTLATEDTTILNDRQAIVPTLLVFNGSLMGLFIIAAYVFLDKKEGVIKAYAVTASPVWQYLMSKALMIMVVSTITSFMIVIPIMGGGANYPLLLVFLIASGFFASALGLVLTSFYKDIIQSFAVLYILIIVLMLPNIAYFLPSWNPAWIQVIPTYAMLQSFRETLMAAPDVAYVLLASLGFVVAGGLLFAFADMRFKQTLTV